MKRDTPTVEVLLATYQSERFLEELLNSLANQTYTEFQLTVADDASTDATLDILNRCAPLFRQKVKVIRRPQPTGSAQANFAQLLMESQGDYIFLADHDDVWDEDKIETGLKRLRSLEDQVGSDTPVITHSDLRVVDADAQPKAPSLWRLKAIDPELGCDLRTAVVHATVTGCAMAMNRATIARCGPIPPEAIMHDWWLNLVAAAFGRVDFDPQPRLRYRVHGSNVSRPRPPSPWPILRQRQALQVLRTKVARRMDQAHAFAERFGPAAPPPLAEFLADLRQFPGLGPIARRKMLIQHSMWMPGLWRNAGLLVAV